MTALFMTPLFKALFSGRFAFSIVISMFFPHVTYAAPSINAGDTTWVLISIALVMLMTPGLAFFYSGMVHTKNVVATIMHSFMKLSVISIIWVLWGYSFAFGTSFHGLIGGFDFIGFRSIGQEIQQGLTIPHIAFATFQGMFAVITAAIITGAFAERVRLGPVLFFSSVWITLVYAPVAHWVWGGGWIAQHLEALDFAGGAVVHINSAVAGLVAALCLGKRENYSPEIKPHNMPLTILGGALLWFGWFGFNAGSALSAGALASIAMANTNLAAATGALFWFMMEYRLQKKATALGAISGSVAGLVAITPAAGYVTPMASIVIGAAAGLFCYYAVAVLKPRLGYDDSLDVFGIHGVGGIWGAVATGLFATTSINSEGANGLFYGNPSLLLGQIVSIVCIMVYSAIATYVVLKIVRVFVRMRVQREEENVGLDISVHGEKGYNLQ